MWDAKARCAPQGGVNCISAKMLAAAAAAAAGELFHYCEMSRLGRHAL